MSEYYLRIKRKDQSFKCSYSVFIQHQIGRGDQSFL